MFPAAVITAAGVLLLTWPRRPVAAGPGGRWQRESVLPGWSIGRLWRLSLISCGVIAASGQRPAPDPDRPAGHRAGLRSADRLVDADRRRQLPGRHARGPLGVPDPIFATVTQYMFLAAVEAVGMTATAGAAVLQHQRS